MTVPGISNIPNLDVLRASGANVYDIVRAHRLVLTTDAVASLAERFGATVYINESADAALASDAPGAAAAAPDAGATSGTRQG